MIKINRMSENFSFLKKHDSYLHGHILKDVLEFNYELFIPETNTTYSGFIAVPYSGRIEDIKWFLTEDSPDFKIIYRNIDKTPEWFSSLFFAAEKKLNELTRIRNLLNT